jgi:hypothetical protein
MNNGTKVRTALRIAVSLYTGFMIWQAAIASMGYKKLTIVWAFLTIAAGWAVDALTTYYNNDYTETAAKHTANMRQEKRELKEGYIGDRFFTADDDLEEDEDE